MTIPTPTTTAMISIPEAAERLAVPATDVYRLIDSRSLPAFKNPRGFVVVPDGALRAVATPEPTAAKSRSSND